MAAHSLSAVQSCFGIERDPCIRPASYAIGELKLSSSCSSLPGIGRCTKRRRGATGPESSHRFRCSAQETSLNHHDLATQMQEDGESAAECNRTAFIGSIARCLGQSFSRVLRSSLSVSCRPETDEPNHTNPSKEYSGFGLNQASSLILGCLSVTASASPPKFALADLFANPTFTSALIAWTLAQTLKVFTNFSVTRKFELKMLVASGGMPSSHSALCSALTTSIALLFGLNSPLFPVCLGFTLIVMYDATSVRYQAGIQAEVLNVVMSEILQGHPVSEKKLKELLGHTPLQVAAGALLGVVSSLLYHSRLTTVV